ncbi:hypothetical protein HPB48_012961 [Haemaphysalis longicornis]|uniref:Uncharacterized protein n=1 Tax=Haemaphysalis longicornis TaxID=44386 RepID=A0A9J6FRU1_HAELO|nr:hypothetical protein HPB48_012961 [Haemaphysalis longicornis]
MPVHSSSENVLGMAKHNTVRKITEAHLSNQRIRLSQTPAGRAVQGKIGWQVAYHQEKGPIPTMCTTIIESKSVP